MKNIKYLATLFLIFSISSQCWSSELKEWSVTSLNHKVSFSSSGSITKYENKVELAITNEGELSSPEGLLSKYYWLLKHNRIDEVADLYGNKDGSKRRFKHFIEAKKLKLDKYTMLSDVYILGVQKWDAFTFVSVKLIAENGMAVSWQETVVCEVRCYLIFEPLKIDSVSEMLDMTKMTYLESNRVYGDLTGKIKYKNKPLKIVIPHPDSNMYSGRKYPLTFNLDIVKFRKNRTVNQNVSCEYYTEYVDISFCHFLDDMNDMNILDEDYLNDYFTKLTGKPSSTGVYVNTYDEKKIKTEFYSNQAFTTFVKKWDSVHLIGYLENDTTIFVLFKPQLNTGTILPFQVVTFDKTTKSNSNKIIYGSNWEDTYLFFYNNIFANSLDVATSSW